VARRILVGFDGEAAADRALDRAIEEARRDRSRLLVLAVAEMPLDPMAPREFGTAGDAPTPPSQLGEPPWLEPILARARDRVAAAGVHADLFWAAGEPADKLLAAAAAERVDLIVLGSHHHSVLGRLFGVDVADEVRRRAGCEVLVVP
jgi:nucleotide-binding universal stress UspA family protein